MTDTIRSANAASRPRRRTRPVLRVLAVAALGLVVGLAGAMMPHPASAQVRIDITRGVVEPMPIAISNFLAVDPSGAPFDSDIPGVIASDLASSGLFRPIDRNAFLQAPGEMTPLPDFADWRQINAQALVTGQVRQEGNQIAVEFRLWDVFGQSQMAGVVYRVDPKLWRRVAHMIADQIYERITGEGGYFDTQIVYVAESGPADKRVKRLAIMDQDGANHRYLTDGQDLVLTPRLSPNAREITYMAFRNRQARVFVYDLDTGRQRVLGDFPGMTFAPRFTPDGRSVLMSMARDGATSLYKLDVASGAVQRLTSSQAIDTSPSVSPDGKRMVFNSDRSGGQQIYVANADGSGLQRISFGTGTYATPVWSPRGDLIAFTKMNRGRFVIGVMRPDGSDERLLTDGYLVEGPTWAPNGRVLAFFRKDRPGGETRLYSIDITGYNERLIVTPGEASDPAWSALIR
ncbi:protein TolB [Tistrella bauzanensis]|uniref:Tol-Pal system protein TolB n=1 Tax=Tistrella bauzanensis TaxID=657419 RepID=A0ABQ1IAM2_9PROT|nr:protein TolB [Tistrella bauzanensis]